METALSTAYLGLQQGNDLLSNLERRVFVDECCKEMAKWTYELCAQEIREVMERK